VTLLAVESVCVSFTRGSRQLRVLRDASVEISAGQLLVIYGQRAAGKTTLLEVAAGLRHPDTGRVTFDGRDLTTLSHRDLAQLYRKEIGWVERDGPAAGEWPMRVYVGMPLYRTLGRDEADDRAIAMLERVGAGEYADVRWRDLPHTVRPLIAIAQVLIREPRLLIVDDPLYGLGVTDSAMVVGLLRDLAEQVGVAVLLAVPELTGALHAHQVRVFANGKLVGAPPPDDAGTVLEFSRTRRSV
jgi:ABC-type lipoprotein export system ATPase subunit